MRDPVVDEFVTEHALDRPLRLPMRLLPTVARLEVHVVAGEVDPATVIRTTPGDGQTARITGVNEHDIYAGPRRDRPLQRPDLVRFIGVRLVEVFSRGDHCRLNLSSTEPLLDYLRKSCAATSGDDARCSNLPFRFSSHLVQNFLLLLPNRFRLFSRH